MEPERSLKLSIWEGVLAILFLNWSTGVMVTGYALALGASPQALALLGALPQNLHLCTLGIVMLGGPLERGRRFPV